MPDEKLSDRSDEMEHHLNRLEDQIGDAETKLEARRKDAEAAGEPAGARSGDAAQGDDAADGGDTADQGEPQDRPDEDERVDEEMANPT